MRAPHARTHSRVFYHSLRIRPFVIASDDTLVSKGAHLFVSHPRRSDKPKPSHDPPSDEDHTLGNALRHVLMQNKEVDFCGYSVPHPSEPKMNLRLQTTGNFLQVSIRQALW